VAAQRSSVSSDKTPTTSTVVAVAEGHRPGLIALRDKLAEAIDLAEPAVVAQIAGRLQAVLDRLAELDAASPPEVSSVDELLDRRRRSEAGATTSSGRARNVRRR
jgi:hypothetical protein